MDDRLVLPKNTVLDQSYRIERVIGAGGFGITYEAEDIRLSATVAIKEYYPEQFADRDATMSVGPKSARDKGIFEWGRERFLQEARTLARFRHPSIVRVSRVFEANSCAYMAMDFERGQNFEAWLRGLGRPPSQEMLDGIVSPLLDALEIMHGEHFLHRDIAPDNIIVRPNGTPVLLDFGAARHAVADRSHNLTGIVKARYSPPEQYGSKQDKQGPWSDIYALGATLYLAVMGMQPPDSPDRVVNEEIKPTLISAKGNYRPDFLRGIDSALEIKPENRPQSVAAWRTRLMRLSLEASGWSGEIDRRPFKKPASRKGLVIWSTGVIAGLVIVGTYVYMLPELPRGWVRKAEPAPRPTPSPPKKEQSPPPPVKKAEAPPSRSPTEQIEAYVTGLRGGQYAFSISLSGHDAAQQIGFGARFASVYSEGLERSQAKIARAGSVHIDEIIAIFDDVLQQEKAIDKIASGQPPSAAITYLRALQDGVASFPNPKLDGPTAEKLLLDLARAYPDIRINTTDPDFKKTYEDLSAFGRARMQHAGLSIHAVTAELRRLIIAQSR